jgi:hypothetical protein
MRPYLGRVVSGFAPAYVRLRRGEPAGFGAWRRVIPINDIGTSTTRGDVYGVGGG